MSLPELLRNDLSPFPKRSAQTVNKNLALLGGLFARAERDGFFEGVPGWSNPFHVGFEIARSEKQPFEPFSLSELQKLFASPVFTEGLDHMAANGSGVLVPVDLALQWRATDRDRPAKVGDVRQGEGGIWFFDFSDRGEDQRLKNELSARFRPDPL